MLITSDYDNDRNDNVSTNGLQVSLIKERKKKKRTNVHYFSRFLLFLSLCFSIFHRKRKSIFFVFIGYFCFERM